MQKQPVLVGIVKDEKQWDLIKNKKWYHLPVSVNSAPENPARIRYVAFYFPASFNGEHKYKVMFYAEMTGVVQKKRIELFPNEPENPKANEDYFQFHLGEIQKLSKAIVSRNNRDDIIHIPTNTEKLFNAEEINDLWWENSPLEDIMHSEFKRRKIEVERQWHVLTGGQHYFLDFALFAGDRKIDVECDGGQHYSTQEAIDADKRRDELLNGAGWKVLRFTWEQINQNLNGCFEIVESII